MKFRKGKNILAFLVVVVTALQLSTMNVLAAENSDNTIGTFQKPFSINMSNKESPHYFIPDSTFTFSDYNIGKSFYVPKACQGRMIISIVPEDASANDYVNIQVRSQADGRIFHSENVQTCDVKLIVVDYMGAGWNYIYYNGARNNVDYIVHIEYYTWDY